MAKERKKTRKGIKEQAESLIYRAKGNDARIAKIKEIQDRYISNMDKNPKIQRRLQRNQELREMMGTNPSRNDLYRQWKGTDAPFDKEKRYTDQGLRGLIGQNTAFVNAHPMTRSEYMEGKAKASSNG